MRKIFFLFALLISVFFLLGCTQQPAQKLPVNTPPQNNSTAVANPATPPSITLSQQLPSTSNSSWITITGTTRPFASVAINGHETSADSNGAFSQSVQLTEGPNTISITSTDSFGNKNTVTRAISYAKPSPAGPGNDFYVPPNGTVTTVEQPIVAKVGSGYSEQSNGTAISFVNVLPGSASVASVALTNSFPTIVHLEFNATGDVAKFVSVPMPVTLYSLNEQRLVEITLTVPQGTAFGQYNGSVVITETRAPAS